EIFGRERHRRDLAIPDVKHAGRTGDCELAQAVGSMNYVSALEAEPGERAGDLFRRVFGPGAGYLNLRVRWIRKRAEVVERGSHLEFQPHRLDVLHGCMKRRGEEKRDSCFADGS